MRDVVCLTEMDRARLRESRWSAYQRSDVELILDTLDVAVAALWQAWRTWYYPTAEYSHKSSEKSAIEFAKLEFCRDCNLTLPQAEALGIFEEGT